MPVESDSDRAAFFDADDFGEAVAWSHAGTTVSVTGLFSAPRTELRLGDGPGTIAAETTFLCPAVALPAGAGQGDTLDRGGVSYRVRAFLPDGTGLVTAHLERG